MKSSRSRSFRRSRSLRGGWKSVKKSNPKLWEKVLDEVRKKPGKWAAWKSMLAVKMYKERGGKYLGRR